MIVIPVGDLDGSHKEWEFETETQNYPDGTEPDGRGGILKVTSDAEPVSSSAIIGDETPVNLYHAYGVRNSFGINFDPITGNLWGYWKWTGEGDEINLVEPGFISGRFQAQGMSSSNNNNIESEDENNRDLASSNLVDFDEKGKYSDLSSYGVLLSAPLLLYSCILIN